MKQEKLTKSLIAGAVVIAGGVVAFGWWASAGHAEQRGPRFPAPRAHLDHAPFFNEPFETGEEVTAACRTCHEEQAQELKHTPHWEWVGEPEQVPGTQRRQRLGKKNLINNFCISIKGNWAACTKCHAGYGWRDESFDFDDISHADCLVCHDHSGTYAKTLAGEPREDVDLLVSAKSVGLPTRAACSSCHTYGGGGLAVKHGDIDSTLENPDEQDDVHMGRVGMTCLDCHGGKGHDIRGKLIAVSTNHDNGIACTDCHAARPHQNARLDAHTERVACQSCHIPTFANSIPTKMWWDWSKAGDDTRKDDVHRYLKIKGEFRYDTHVTPEYAWFDGTADRYLAGDRIPDQGPVKLNPPRGGPRGPGAKIWPFKIHRGKQIFDTENRTLLTPVTSGEGGYWHDFDWDQALRLATKVSGLPYSGHYGFVETEMHWPLNHMVQPKDRALHCVDCHGPQGRMDWRALGYPADPMNTGATP